MRSSSLGDVSEAPPSVLPPLQHRSFAGSAGETLAEVDQSLKGLPADIAALQSWASPSNKELVINRLDRISIELALMEVRLGELKINNNRMTQSEENQIVRDQEALTTARAAVAKVAAD